MAENTALLAAVMDGYVKFVQPVIQIAKNPLSPINPKP
jgi:hypothetical protein